MDKSGMCSVGYVLSGEMNRERTLQIALCSEGVKGIKAGLRIFPADKLIVLYTNPRRSTVEELLDQLKEVLEIDAEAFELPSSGFEEVFDVLSSALTSNKNQFGTIYVNLSEGDKVFSCSALAASFLFGVKAFYITEDNPYVFPIIRMGYQKILPETKLNILRVVAKAGGVIRSLEELSQLMGYDKSQLSYHINGAADSRGLVKLGLLRVERGERGSLLIRLTPQAKILLLSSNMEF